jgi:hypothetical protein
MSISSSLLFALIYADIFQYPYTYDELVGWMPNNIWHKNDIKKIIRQLLKIKKIFYSEPFFTVYGHKKNITTRVRRERYALDKWMKAEHAANMLRFIPTIMFVGVTGSLAIRNADRQDDIDLFICTKNKSLWITRFLAITLLELYGIRRRPEEHQVKDAICLNMFVTEDALSIPPKERDIYVAHEVLQMQVVWERKGTYGSFLHKNRWVRNFFKHTWMIVVQKHKKMQPRITYHEANKFVIHFITLFEKSAKRIQLWYMKKRRTTEVVSDTIVRFHPHDARKWIYVSLQKKLNQYDLPLDKIFFHP